MSVVGGGGDSLTRTTLQIAGTMTVTLIADTVHALQRVPGVLLADMSAGNSRVIVAHDGAVPTNALVTAAAGAGVLATIVRDRPGAASPDASTASPDLGAAPAALRPEQRTRMIIVLAGIALGLVLVELLFPDTLAKRVIINGVVLVIWIGFFARAFVRKP